MVFTNGFLFSHDFDLDENTHLLLDGKLEGIQDLTFAQLSERFDAFDVDRNGCEYMSFCYIL